MLIQKLLQVLGSQLAFVQHLFQCEPEALKCQEDDRVQLEVRARALQQRALEQEVAFQTRLQVWSKHLLKAIRIHTYTNEASSCGVYSALNGGLGLCLDVLQEWSRWEDNCGQLGRELDELEAFISSGEPERDEECISQQRLDTCQVAPHCAQTRV